MKILTLKGILKTGIRLAGIIILFFCLTVYCAKSWVLDNYLGWHMICRNPHIFNIKYIFFTIGKPKFYFMCEFKDLRSVNFLYIKIYDNKIISKNCQVQYYWHWNFLSHISSHTSISTASTLPYHFKAFRLYYKDLTFKIA